MPEPDKSGWDNMVDGSFESRGQQCRSKGQVKMHKASASNKMSFGRAIKHGLLCRAADGQEHILVLSFLLCPCELKLALRISWKRNQLPCLCKVAAAVM